jgi:hypothetical protein
MSEEPPYCPFALLWKTGRIIMLFVPAAVVIICVGAAIGGSPVSD